MPSAQIGLRDMYFAVMQSDTAGGTTVYSTPVQLAGAITATINPNASEETIFADDGPAETATTLGKISLEFEIQSISMENQATLLGHSIDSHGIIVRKATDVPPWIAIGFRALKANGNYRYVWLLKGKLLEPEMMHETKGDKIKFQLPKHKVSFVKRDSDQAWIRQADQDSPNYSASITTNWFTDPNYTPTP